MKQRFISKRKLYQRLAEAKKLGLTLPEYTQWRKRQLAKKGR